MKVKSESEVTQSCPTLLDPMDCGLPGSSILGIFQARVLEWVAIAFAEKHLRHTNKITHLFYPTIYIESEKAMATHSSTLAWKIPWMEGSGGLQSMGSLGVKHD